MVLLLLYLVIFSAALIEESSQAGNNRLAVGFINSFENVISCFNDVAQKIRVKSSNSAATRTNIDWKTSLESIFKLVGTAELGNDFHFDYELAEDMITISTARFEDVILIKDDKTKNEQAIFEKAKTELKSTIEEFHKNKLEIDELWKGIQEKISIHMCIDDDFAAALGRLGEKKITFDEAHVAKIEAVLPRWKEGHATARNDFVAILKMAKPLTSVESSKQSPVAAQLDIYRRACSHTDSNGIHTEMHAGIHATNFQSFKGYLQMVIKNQHAMISIVLQTWIPQVVDEFTNARNRWGKVLLGIEAVDENVGFIKIISNYLGSLFPGNPLAPSKSEDYAKPQGTIEDALASRKPITRTDPNDNECARQPTYVEVAQEIENRLLGIDSGLKDRLEQVCKLETTSENIQVFNAKALDPKCFKCTQDNSIKSSISELQIDHGERMVVYRNQCNKIRVGIQNTFRICFGSDVHSTAQFNVEYQKWQNIKTLPADDVTEIKRRLGVWEDQHRDYQAEFTLQLNLLVARAEFYQEKVNLAESNYLDNSKDFRKNIGLLQRVNNALGSIRLDMDFKVITLIEAYKIWRAKWMWCLINLNQPIPIHFTAPVPVPVPAQPKEATTRSLPPSHYTSTRITRVPSPSSTQRKP